MKTSAIAFLSGLLLACSTVAGAEPPPSISYAYPEQSVWTTKQDANGTAANPLLALADKLFSLAGLRWEAQPLPAARMFESLRNGSANFSMLVRGPALDKCCLIGRQPVATTELRVFHGPAVPPVRSVDDLRGHSVVLIHGYSYAGLQARLSAPDSGVTVDTAASHQAAFTMLTHGRADYLLDYAGPAREVMTEQHATDLRHETLERLQVYLVLSRAYPDAEAMLARLETLAAKLEPIKGAP